MTPDLICMVDLETLTPVTTESLKYGKRVQVMGLKANAAWRTKKVKQWVLGISATKWIINH